MRTLSVLCLLCLLASSLFAQLDSCIIAEFKFNGDLSDDGPSSYPAAFVSSPSYDTNRFGQQGKAVLFDGIDDYIVLNGESPIIHTAPFTVSIWGRMDGAGGGNNSQNMLFSHRDNTAGGGQSIVNFYAQTGGNATECVVRGSMTSQGDRPTTTPAQPYGEWHLYTLTVAEDSIHAYINCSLFDAMPNSQSGDFSTSIDYVRVGMHRFNSIDQGFFNGAVDDLKIYECALTPMEVCELFNDTSDLVVHGDTNHGDTNENGTSSIEEINTQSLQLYPNPTRTDLQINVPNLKVGEYSITSMTGQVVERGTMRGPEMNLDVRSYPAGVYMVQVITPSGDRFRKEFIRQ